MKVVSYEIKNKVGVISINRPEKRNALSNQVVSELKAAFLSLQEEKEVKALLLRTAGDIFCSGADLKELQQLQRMSLEENMKDSELLKNLFHIIYTCPKIVIAAVQGPAIAGGCGLAAACDFIFATPKATFQCPEVRVGFVPAIILFLLIQKIGPQHTKEIMLTGNALTVQSACQKGLVYEVVEEDALEERIFHFIGSLIRKNSHHAMQVVKSLHQKLQTMPEEQALNYAAQVNATFRTHDDYKTGIDSFLNKTAIDWSNL